MLARFCMGMSGSIFSDNGILGFIVVGVLAFLLGICVTVFCFKTARFKDDEEEG